MNQCNNTPNSYNRVFYLVFFTFACAVGVAESPFVDEAYNHLALGVVVDLRSVEAVKHFRGSSDWTWQYNFKNSSFPLLYDLFLNTRGQM